MHPLQSDDTYHVVTSRITSIPCIKEIQSLAVLSLCRSNCSFNCSNSHHRIAVERPGWQSISEHCTLREFTLTKHQNIVIVPYSTYRPPLRFISRSRSGTGLLMAKIDAKCNSCLVPRSKTMVTVAIFQIRDFVQQSLRLKHRLQNYLRIRDWKRAQRSQRLTEMSPLQPIYALLNELSSHPRRKLGLVVFLRYHSSCLKLRLFTKMNARISRRGFVHLSDYFEVRGNFCLPLARRPYD